MGQSDASSWMDGMVLDGNMGNAFAGRVNLKPASVLELMSENCRAIFCICRGAFLNRGSSNYRDDHIIVFWKLH